MADTVPISEVHPAGSGEYVLIEKDRLDAFTRILERMAGGETGLRQTISSRRDALDALAFGVNVLVEELAYGKLLADRANEAKSMFLANFSHEVRTPLTAILGFSDILKSNNLSKEETDQLLKRIKTNGAMLLSLVDDLIDLSKIEHGELSIDDEDLAIEEWIREVFGDLSPRARKKGIAFQWIRDGRLPAWVRTDKVRLRQVLSNVLGNAIKYTSEGRVLLVVRYEEPMLQFDVSDTGIGVEPELTESLFQVFTRGRRAARDTRGAGLGLALSRRICESMGGTLTLLRSKPNEGTTFRVTVRAPAATAAAEVVAPAPARDPWQLKGMRVLVADDAPDNRLLIVHLLQQAGAEVSVACDGEEAMQLIEKGLLPDIILLDLQMPRLDGFQTLARVRAAGIGCPVAALTAHALDEHREACQAAGFDTFLTKPIETDRLVGELSSLALRGCPSTYGALQAAPVLSHSGA